MSNKVSRRGFLRGAGAGVGVSAAAGLAAGCGSSRQPIASPPSVNSLLYTDNDILNFALNLEYLEAEFYLRAATGAGLTDADAGANAGAVTGGAQVAFTNDAAGQAIKAYALELANDELLHVRFLRSALGSAAVSRPAIDFTNAFNAAATAAGIPGGTFNPFADQNSFIVGSFVFEDVGVTAYHGAAGLITDKTKILPAAAGILGTEAYHAGTIRLLLATLGQQPSTAQFLTYANQISALRATAGGGNETTLSSSTIVAADPTTSIAYARTLQQVLHIVYLSAAAGPVSKGGFFPNGLNGTITATMS